MLRFALIGAGGIGALHLRWAARHAGVQVVAVCDPDPVRAGDAARPFAAKAYADHRAMLADGGIDFVGIAVPHMHLASIGLDCLNAGCHVLLEKPLARHIGEAAPLLKLAQDKGLKLGCSYQYRSFATPRTIRRLIDEGHIGQVRHIQWNWHELRAASYYTQSPWRGSWEGAGGGLLMNQLSHDIDLLRLFGGPVASVEAQLACHAHDFALEDALAASIRFASGALATVSASINHPRARCQRAILGDKGMIVLPDAQNLAMNPNDVIDLGIYETPIKQAIASQADHHRQPPIRWTRINSNPPARSWLPGILRPPLRAIADKMVPSRGQWRGQRPTSGHGLALWQFADAIAENGPLPPDLDAASALATLEILNALVLAGTEGRRISLPLDTSAYGEMFARACAGEAVPGAA